MSDIPLSVIDDWLHDISVFHQDKLQSHAASLQHDDELISALYIILDLDDSPKYSDLFQPVSEQLFAYYKSRDPILQRFTLQFLPSFIYIYLSSVAAGDKKKCKPIETLLLFVYNLEVTNSNQSNAEAKIISFRVPSLAQNSIYHEPTRESLTESSLRRYEESTTKPVTWGPHPHVERLCAQNRLQVLTALLFVFNWHISSFHRAALRELCKTALKLVSRGFPKPGHHKRESEYFPKLPLRIPVSQPFLLELSSGLYYAMYNDFGSMAMQAIEEIHQRACYQGFSDVLLVTSAIKNSSHVTPTGEPAEGPMGISVALSPSTTTVTTVNKSMITNASFRTKKLPDDIPIVSAADANAAGDKSLISITEEEEASMTPRGSSLRGRDAVTKNLQKLGIGKKIKPLGSGGKAKGVKSPLVQNGEVTEKSTDSPANSAGKRRSVVADSGFNGDSCDSIVEDVSPGVQKKFSADHDDIKPVMQVSSV